MYTITVPTRRTIVSTVQKLISNVGKMWLKTGQRGRIVYTAETYHANGRTYLQCLVLHGGVTSTTLRVRRETLTTRS